MTAAAPVMRQAAVSVTVPQPALPNTATVIHQF
jgi:hypothetical protein